MRVLHVVAPAAHIGGLERVVATLTGGQAAAGLDVHIAIADHGGRMAPVTPDSGGVTTHQIRVAPRAYVAERDAVADLCRRLAPDVLHTHGYRVDAVAGSAAQRAGVPAISTVHGFTGGGVRNVLYAWIQCRALRGFDTVVAVSPSIRERLLRAGVRAERVHVVPNALEPVSLLAPQPARDLLHLPRDRFVIGWVGRLSPEKGGEVFLAALARVRHLPVRAVVLGDGPERPRLESLAASLGLRDMVRFAGEVRDAARCLSALDVLALSSHTEGSPVVVLEAMSAGVPIVATDVGGVRELVGNEGACLVPRGDSLALARALVSVYEQRDAALLRARAARLRFHERFRVGPWVERYDALYRGVHMAAVA